MTSCTSGGNTFRSPQERILMVFMGYGKGLGRISPRSGVPLGNQTEFERSQFKIKKEKRNHLYYIDKWT